MLFVDKGYVQIAHNCYFIPLLCISPQYCLRYVYEGLPHLKTDYLVNLKDWITDIGGKLPDLYYMTLLATSNVFF